MLDVAATGVGGSRMLLSRAAAADARAPVPTTAVSITLRFLRKSIACVAGRLI